MNISAVYSVISNSKYKKNKHLPFTVCAYSIILFLYNYFNVFNSVIMLFYFFLRLFISFLAPPAEFDIFVKSTPAVTASNAEIPANT